MIVDILTFHLAGLAQNFETGRLQQTRQAVEKIETWEKHEIVAGLKSRDALNRLLDFAVIGFAVAVLGRNLRNDQNFSALARKRRGELGGQHFFGLESK